MQKKFNRKKKKNYNFQSLCNKKFQVMEIYTGLVTTGFLNKLPSVKYYK